MAIAMINAESCSGGALLHADLATARGPESGRAPSAPVPASAASAPSLMASSLASPSPSPAPFYKLMPAANVVRTEAFAPAPRGYAPARGEQGTTSRASAASAVAVKAQSSSALKSSSAKTTAKKSSSAKTTTKKSSTSSKGSASRELAFLDDKHLSIEEKLFQFMALMTKKNDQELVDAMKEYEAKKTASKSSSSSENASSSTDKASSSSASKSVISPDGGGGFFGFLGDALGSIGKMVVGSAETLAKDLGGPALAGLATAVGMPFLAPVALQVGGSLSAELIDGVASTVGLGTKAATHSSNSAAKSSSSSSSKSAGTSSKTTKTTSPADPDEFDEKLEMLKLQRLVEKQNAMFSALTNAMKAMHDMQMTAVQNIR